MVSKQVKTLEHMTCQCGRHPRLMENKDNGATTYTVEAHCCKTLTIPLKTMQAAVNEFARLRSVQESDPTSWPEDATYRVNQMVSDGRLLLWPKGQRA